MQTKPLRIVASALVLAALVAIPVRWMVAAEPAPAAEVAAPAGKLKFQGKLVAFGDSITFCQGFADGGRWHDRVATWSDGKIKNVNAGKNGRTTGALAELKAVLKANPDAGAVLIKLGVNDLKNVAANDPKAVATIVANVGAMVDQVKADLPKAKTVIVAPANISPAKLAAFWKKLKFGEHSQAMLQSLSTEYAKLAREKGVGFVSAYGSVTEANIPDGIHPDPAGQAELAKSIWTGLVSIGF